MVSTLANIFLDKKFYKKPWERQPGYNLSALLVNKFIKNTQKSLHNNFGYTPKFANTHTLDGHILEWVNKWVSEWVRMALEQISLRKGHLVSAYFNRSLRQTAG